MAEVKQIIDCPQCGGKLRVPGLERELDVRCGHCDSRFRFDPKKVVRDAVEGLDGLPTEVGKCAGCEGLVRVPVSKGARMMLSCPHCGGSLVTGGEDVVLGADAAPSSAPPATPLPPPADAARTKESPGSNIRWLLFFVTSAAVVCIIYSLLRPLTGWAFWALLTAYSVIGSLLVVRPDPDDDDFGWWGRTLGVAVLVGIAHIPFVEATVSSAAAQRVEPLLAGLVKQQAALVASVGGRVDAIPGRHSDSGGPHASIAPTMPKRAAPERRSEAGSAIRDAQFVQRRPRATSATSSVERDSAGSSGGPTLAETKTWILERIAAGAVANEGGVVPKIVGSEFSGNCLVVVDVRREFYASGRVEKERTTIPVMDIGTVSYGPDHKTDDLYYWYHIALKNGRHTISIVQTGAWNSRNRKASVDKQPTLTGEVKFPVLYKNVTPETVNKAIMHLQRLLKNECRETKDLF